MFFFYVNLTVNVVSVPLTGKPKDDEEWNEKGWSWWSRQGQVGTVNKSCRPTDSQWWKIWSAVWGDVWTKAWKTKDDFFCFKCQSSLGNTNTLVVFFSLAHQIYSFFFLIFLTKFSCAFQQYFCCLVTVVTGIVSSLPAAERVDRHTCSLIQGQTSSAACSLRLCCLR